MLTTFEVYFFFDAAVCSYRMASLLADSRPRAAHESPGTLSSAAFHYVRARRLEERRADARGGSQRPRPRSDLLVDLSTLMAGSILHDLRAQPRVPEERHRSE